jgi:hypothetical protein
MQRFRPPASLSRGDAARESSGPGAATP